jgi:hypothetical protein
MQEQERYYLNNMSDNDIQITLSTQRNVPAKASLPLNTKDIEIVKKLKKDRQGKPCILDNLKLSTINLNEDARFIKNVEKVSPVQLTEPVNKEAEVEVKPVEIQNEKSST